MTNQAGAGDLDAIVEEFFAAHFGFYPTQAAEAGLHEFDPLTGRRDAAAIEAYVRQLRDLEGRLEAAGRWPLGASAALDRELLLREARAQLFWLVEVGSWRRDPRFYASQMDLSFLLLSTYAPLDRRMAAIIERLEAFPDLVRAARANIENPPRPFVETALVNFGGLPRFLRRDLTRALASVDDPALQSRFQAVRDAAADELEAYTAILTDLLPSAGGDFALGPERYRRMNALLAGVDIPLDRLERIGRAEVERLLELGRSLAAQVAPGCNLADAFGALGEDGVPAGDIVRTAAGDIEELVRFVEASRVATRLPGRVQVKEIPGFRRTNFAYILIPGPFESANTGLYFIHPVDESWSERDRLDYLRRHHRWTILNTSAHETYPGHYHHFTHLHRSSSKTQRLLWSYVTVEGWAHYAEEMSWRLGLADSSPRLGLAVVQDGLLRAVRFLSSLGLHTRGMTVEESERMFREIAYQDPRNARQQALRGTYDPEYLNYTLGKLMIHELRDDLARERDGKLDLRAFHDEFMACGAPPVPWIARRMLGDPEWQPFRSRAGSPGSSATS